MDQKIIETSLNVFFNMSPDLFCIVSGEGKFMALNPAWESTLGYSIENLRGKKFIEIVHPEDVLQTLNQFELQNKGKETINFINRYRCSDNSYKLLEWRGQTGSDGTIYAVARDISEKRQSEDLILKQKEVLESITRSLRDAIIMLDNTGNITFWNKAASSIFGYSIGEAMGQNLHKLISPVKYLSAHNEAFPNFQLTGQGSATGKTLELTAVHKNGTEFPVEISMSGFKDKDSWQSVGVIRDITERKVSEEALKKSEQKFRQIFHNMQDVYVMTNIDGKILEISPSIKRLLNFDREELIGTQVDDLYFNREDRQKVIREVGEKGELLDYELRLRHKNDQMVWASVNNHNVFDNEGNFLGIETIVRDISFRKHAEDEMQKLSTAVEHSPVSIVISDLEGKIVYANPKAVETTGYSLEELIGQNPRVLKSGETPQEEYRKLWETISSGNQWSGTFHNKKKNGILYWESSSISPILDSTGKIINYVAVKEDITEKKKINDELIASEAKLKEANTTKDKLFSIIGHDLRSSIGSFQPILELLADESNLEESEKNVLLNALIQGSKTAYSLLENLLSWASGQSNRINLEPVNFYINEIIECNIDLLSSSAYQKSITITVNNKEPVSAFADRNSIDLVVRNLLSNAIKFTNEKGNITIDITDHEDFVEIGIADNGIGIKKDLADNLFSTNSFYTTLGTNFEKGSGLGLVLCKDFVEKNGGKIRVESVVGEGSRFIFTIPKRETES